MIKVGTLWQVRPDRTHLEKTEDLCEIVEVFDKPDIDPRCGESVEIVTWVKAIWLSGEMQGKYFRSTQWNFTYRWKEVK